ncbi:hypothetical protein K466DRAFT_592119 [Polyporus arcularius HHB13444]|uniref:Secreted protein n=1 Tax=Polyporus arcularius HHB13444 TaxID=1314778 RepID=A0A5C3NTQ5_9APHY|nr:hypothetical protein K466DRAFT_592119 [Polyporus arcularius HHB13444]
MGLEWHALVLNFLRCCTRSAAHLSRASQVCSRPLCRSDVCDASGQSMNTTIKHYLHLFIDLAFHLARPPP